uniref:Uncharacterized protein n=1 Tax=Leptobrachium leishanense TaxID=445787 RepID=A0A8C5MQ26_9ANUR
MNQLKSLQKQKNEMEGLSPSPSDTSSVLSAGYQLQDKDLDKLHRAAYSGDVSKIKQLLRKQDVNQQDNASRTPLHLACANGQTDVVSMLVENHAKVNLCDSENRSPLMKAIQCQQESCAAVLLGHNADPNVVDVNGNAALHFAARIPSITIASQLLEHGADIDAPNKDGCTPLMLATIENNEEMVEFLLREGANINSKDVNERTAPFSAAKPGGKNTSPKAAGGGGGERDKPPVPGAEIAFSTTDSNAERSRPEVGGKKHVWREGKKNTFFFFCGLFC